MYVSLAVMWLRHLPVVLGNHLSKLSCFLRSSSTTFALNCIQMRLV
jgi:hypothetical protein